MDIATHLISLALTALATQDSSPFRVTFEKENFEIVEPFHREATIWATFENLSREDDTIHLNILRTGAAPSPGGKVYLPPGERRLVEVAHIERRMKPEGETLTLTVRMESMRHPGSSVEKRLTVRFVENRMEQTAKLTARVYDAETKRPIPSAELYCFTGPQSRTEALRNEGEGRYTVPVAEAEDVSKIAAAHGIDWAGYTLEVSAPGYESRVETGIKADQDLNRKLFLKPLSKPARFKADWRKELEYPGVWRVRPSRDWRYVAVAMGKHPDPGDPKPTATHVYLFTAAGEMVWKHPVDDAVWGMDIAADGSRVVAGSLSGTLAMIDKAGKIVWSKKTRSNLREMRFSNDGSLVAGETDWALEIRDARSGRAISRSSAGIETHWRGVAFTKDDKLAAFAGAGSLVLVDVAAQKPVWQKYIAQVPYDVRFTSDDSRLTIADKGGNLWCYGAKGDLLWHVRDLPVLTDMDMSDDGSRTAALSHDGTIRMYDRDGKLLWRRSIGFGGHNALDMTADGRLLAVGGGKYAVFLFDSAGNLVGKHSQTGPTPRESHPYTTSTMSVALADDGSRIVVGYGTENPGIQFFSIDP